MCGRFYLTATPHDLAALFFLAGMPELSPRYNNAPTQSVLTVGLNREGKPAVATFRWGIIPPWAAEPKPGPINARAETVADKPTFAEAFRKRRCLIPASGFYEWVRDGKAKHPHAIRLDGGRPFAFAGLWEAWRPEVGPPLLTCCILTTAANELMKPIHDRMSVILDPKHYALWMDRQVQEPAELAEALRPGPAGALTACALSPWVNDARRLGPAA